MHEGDCWNLFPFKELALHLFYFAAKIVIAFLVVVWLHGLNVEFWVPTPCLNCLTGLKLPPLFYIINK